jgi:hypothetical protein
VVAQAPVVTDTPRDLHELLALLPPGWVWSVDRSGLWREGCAMWVKRAGFGGRVEVYGSGMNFTGPLAEAYDYMKRMGVA